MNTQTARLPSSMEPGSSSAFRPEEHPKPMTPRPPKHRPVLAALKAKPCGRRCRAGLDRRSARAAPEVARRDEETLLPPNKETGHLPCYQIRTSVRVIDTHSGFGKPFASEDAQAVLILIRASQNA